MQKKTIIINPEKDLEEFENYLYERENASATIRKYLTDIRTFLKTLDGNYEISKTDIIKYKEWLIDNYAVSSVNSMLVALSQFLEFLGVSSMKVRRVRVQRCMMAEEDKLLTEEEYKKLRAVAQEQGKGILALILETFVTTGVRVSELKYFTVAMIRKGIVIINNKGKVRKVLLPSATRDKLLYYCTTHQIKSGPVFVTRNGNPINRSNIWTQIKKLCQAAGVDSEKVFPHAFRHLFARIYYHINGNLAALADILGHSSIETTRIYTMDSEEKHRASMEKMNYLIDNSNLPEPA